MPSSSSGHNQVSSYLCENCHCNINIKQKYFQMNYNSRIISAIEFQMEAETLFTQPHANAQIVQ